MRQVYLETVWARDPFPLAQNDKIHGRVAQVLGTHITLLREGMPQDFSLEEGLSLAPGFLAATCLAVGDIVELEVLTEKVSMIKLLVPSQGANPIKTKFDVEQAHQWSNFCKSVREFFIEKDFIELRTPSLVVSPGMEPFLDPFSTDFKFGKSSRELFLPTSPEFHLKKALTLGFDRCFEFKECFRNGEISSTHYPEFLMLEWYRAFQDLPAIMGDITELFLKLQSEFLPEDPVWTPEIIKMEDLWKKILDFDLTPQTNLKNLIPLAKKLALGEGEKDFDDLFNLIFLEKIEPVLKSRPHPVIVWHYPPSQAALARFTQDGWADRFEVYWRGLELANAFHELNDPKEQRRRFLHDQEKKKALGKKIIPVDEEFLTALEWGMPPSSGIALGMERLFMVLFKLDDIRECRLFSLDI